VKSEKQCSLSRFVNGSIGDKMAPRIHLKEKSPSTQLHAARELNEDLIGCMYFVFVSVYTTIASSYYADERYKHVPRVYKRIVVQL